MKASPQVANPPGAPSAKRLRILLVDDHAVVRDGLSNLLNAQPDMEVCAQAETAAQALQVVEKVARARPLDAR